jgi:hypothetical protein
MKAGLATLLLWVLASPGAAQEPFEPQDSVESRYGPYQLLRRRPSGSSLAEYRVVGRLAVTAERAAAAHLSRQFKPDRDGNRLELLAQEGPVQILYMFIPTPVVSDRDVVVRNEIRLDTASRVYRFEWRVASERGPPVPDGVVRIVRSDGSWEFRAAEDGGTHVVFTTLSDVGGRIPRWIVNRLYRGRVLAQFEQLLDELDTLPPDAAPADFLSAP